MSEECLSMKRERKERVSSQGPCTPGTEVQILSSRNVYTLASNAIISLMSDKELDK